MRCTRRSWFAAALAAAALASPAIAQQPAEPISVELNSLEAVSAEKCRLTFVVTNKGAALSTLKVDLAAFGKDGGIRRRVVAELGPARADKTQLRAFDVDAPCDGIGSVLVNDVTACAPASAEACLDRLTLTHRGATRLFK